MFNRFPNVALLLPAVAACQARAATQGAPKVEARDEATLFTP